MVVAMSGSLLFDADDKAGDTDAPVGGLELTPDPLQARFGNVSWNSISGPYGPPVVAIAP